MDQKYQRELHNIVDYNELLSVTVRNFKTAQLRVRRLHACDIISGQL